jgi:hypothetical protein
MSAIAYRTDHVARHELAHALTACVLGWQVGKVSATSDGNTIKGACEITPPPGRSEFQCTLDRIVILLAGRAGCIVGDREDTDLAVQLARGIVRSSQEGQALIDYAQARAITIVESAIDSGIFEKFVEMLDSDGVIDLRHEATRDFAPLFEIRTAPITINVPPAAPPVVNVTIDPTPVTVEVPPQPDKLITFHRNGDGELIEAETTTAPVAA